MPSKVADELWHAFILDTRACQTFCTQAFGHYFHHIPTSQHHTAADHDAAMERIWRFASQSQGLNPAIASSLPILFALDAGLAIPDGFQHDAQALAQLSKAYDARRQASDSGSSSGCSGAGVSACADAGSSCGGGGCGGAD